MKIKRVSPIDHDIHFKYVCTNHHCLGIHWLSLKECQTKNYKIVCDCGAIFSPKQIKDITVNFVEKEKRDINTSHNPDLEFQNLDDPPPKAFVTSRENYLLEAMATLVSFGFSKTEAESMIKSEYEQTGETNPAKLVKNSLDLFGE